MNITKSDIGKSQLEFAVELSASEFQPYISKGAQKLAQEIKIEGFRPGKAPYDLVKQKVGEITILEEAANLAIRNILKEIFNQNNGLAPIGQPEIKLTKLAPGNPVEYKIVFTLLPEAKLGDFKGLKAKREKTELAESDIQTTLARLAEMRAKEEISDKEAANGDKIILDLEMFLDSVPVEGGQGKGIAILMGKNQIIPGFEQQIAGARKGETREFKLAYPRDFFQKHLAGKPVEFRATVREVYRRILPAVDDSFAKEIGFNSLAGLKESIGKNIQSEKNQQAEQKLESALLTELIEKSRFGDFPQSLVNDEAHALMHDLEHDIESQGGKFEDYLASISKTREQLLLDLAPEAVKRIKTFLAIREIAKQENIIITEQDVENEKARLLKRSQGQKKTEAKIREPEYKAALHSLLLNRRVIDKLKEWNIKT